ncbi:MAG: hypothetical protein MI740_03265 [Halanaerobiales bacterium]|nr:hypothetical protein [Halanaerobiales bacterium]
MKQTFFALITLIFLISFNVAAFELVELEDNNKYSFGVEYGQIFTIDYIALYLGIAGGFRVNDKTYIRAIVGRTDARDELLLIGKPLYFVKNDIDYRVYGFGLVGNLGEDLSIGGGMGFERDWGYGEIAYTTDRYIIISSGLNIYF